MNFLNGQYYVEVRDHQYRSHPSEKKFLRKRDPPQSLRTQYQFQSITRIRKTQKVIKNDNDEVVVKNYPENKQPIFQQPEFNPPNCPSCQRKTW